METAILKVEENKVVNVDGIMTIDKTENGARRMDFLCTEDVEIEAFDGVFRLQAMHDEQTAVQTGQQLAVVGQERTVLLRVQYAAGTQRLAA